MTTAIVIVLSILSAFVGLRGIIWGSKHMFDGWREPVGIFCGGALLLAGIVAPFVAVVTATFAHFDRASCNGFADNSGRETRFVRYTYWTWDCLTPQADGRWISVDSLRAQGDQ